MKIERAFTMVEILVVTAIIATVVTVPIIAFGSLNQNARDTRRKQDVEKVAAALQQYRTEKGKYPDVASYEALATELIPKHLSDLPEDPQSSQSTNYKYAVLNGGNSFILSAGLERNVGGNNELFTVTPDGSRPITGTPPVPSVYLSPTGPGGGDIQRTGTPTRTPTPTLIAANESFARQVGGTGDDVAYDMAVGSDKGMVIVGATNHLSDRQGYLVKYSSLGTKMWEKSITEDNSWVKSVAAVTGGYVLVGGLDTNSFVTKINNNGDVQWTRTISTGTSGFAAEAVVESSAEIFVAGTYTIGVNTAGIGIFKYNKDGTLLRKYYLTQPLVSNSWITDIQPAADGVAIIGSFVNVSDKGEAFFVNLDQDLATIISQKKYTGPGQDYQLNSLIKTSTGYVVAGLSDTTVSLDNANGWLALLESDGDIIGTSVFDGPTNKEENFESIISIPGGYLVTGSTNSFSMRGTDDYGIEGLVMKLNSNGSVNWLKTFGGTGEDRVARAAYQSGTTPYYYIAGEVNDATAAEDEVFGAKMTTNGDINSCTYLYTPSTAMTLSTGGTSTSITFTKSSYADASSNIYTLTFGTPTTTGVNSCN